MAVVTIIGSGMMGQALAFPARENRHEVRLIGSPLDREIIESYIKTDTHPKHKKPFPSGIKYYKVQDIDTAIDGSEIIIGGVSSLVVAERVARAVRIAAKTANSTQGIFRFSVTSMTSSKTKQRSTFFGMNLHLFGENNIISGSPTKESFFHGTYPYTILT